MIAPGLELGLLPLLLVVWFGAGMAYNLYFAYVTDGRGHTERVFFSPFAAGEGTFCPTISVFTTVVTPAAVGFFVVHVLWFKLSASAHGARGGAGWVKPVAWSLFALRAGAAWFYSVFFPAAFHVTHTAAATLFVISESLIFLLVFFVDLQRHGAQPALLLLRLLGLTGVGVELGGTALALIATPGPGRHRDNILNLSSTVFTALSLFFYASFIVQFAGVRARFVARGRDAGATDMTEVAQVVQVACDAALTESEIRADK